MEQFDLKKFLVENKLTGNSKLLKENEQGINSFGEFETTDSLNVGDQVDLSAGVQGKSKFKAEITKIINKDRLTVKILEDRPDIVDYFGPEYGKGKLLNIPVSKVIPPSISWRK